MALTVTSPPYDQTREYKGFEWNGQWDRFQLGGMLHRVTMEGGIAAVVIQDGTQNFAKSGTSFRLAVEWMNMGWRLFETVIYAREGRPGAWWNTRFRVDHEYIFLFLKGERPRTFHKEHLMVPSKHAGKQYGGTTRRTDGSLEPYKEKKTVAALKDRGTIWHYATSNSERNKLKLKHPATFPTLLAHDLIRTFTEPGDLVLDPMAGSGTVPKMASQLDRQYLAFDISPEYCQLMEEWMEA